MRRFRLVGHEEVRITLPEAERAFLEQIVPMLDGVGGDPGDPAAQYGGHG